MVLAVPQHDWLLIIYHLEGSKVAFLRRISTRWWYQVRYIPHYIFDFLHHFAGAAAAWIDAIENFGSGKVSAADVFDPAIRLAEDG